MLFFTCVCVMPGVRELLLIVNQHLEESGRQGGKSFLGEGKGAICLATVPISIRDIASLPVKSYTAVFLFRLSSSAAP